LRPVRQPFTKISNLAFAKDEPAANVHWLQLRGTKRIEHKYMGSFSERGVRIEFMRMPPGATWISADDRARRLFVVLSGDGAAVGESATRLSALQLQSGGTLELSATTEMTLFVIGLPPNRDAIPKSLKSMIWRNYRDHLSRSQPGLPQLAASAAMPAGALPCRRPHGSIRDFAIPSAMAIVAYPTIGLCPSNSIFNRMRDFVADAIANANSGTSGALTATVVILIFLLV
jgi:hypothetical protein